MLTSTRASFFVSLVETFAAYLEFGTISFRKAVPGLLLSGIAIFAMLYFQPVMVELTKKFSRFMGAARGRLIALWSAAVQGEREVAAAIATVRIMPGARRFMFARSSHEAGVRRAAEHLSDAWTERKALCFGISARECFRVLRQLPGLLSFRYPNVRSSVGTGGEGGCFVSSACLPLPGVGVSGVAKHYGRWYVRWKLVCKNLIGIMA